MFSCYLIEYFKKVTVTWLTLVTMHPLFTCSLIMGVTSLCQGVGIPELRQIVVNLRLDSVFSSFSMADLVS